MPYSIVKSGGSYKVINSVTGKVHAQHSTHENALAQLRLLEGIEHGTIKKRKG